MRGAGSPTTRSVRWLESLLEDQVEGLRLVRRRAQVVSDDTVCTVAVIESLLEDRDQVHRRHGLYGGGLTFVRGWGVCLRKWGRLYPHDAFFVRWLFRE